MPQQITDKTAAMIVRATNRLCDFIDEGNSETGAGVKVAREFNLTTDQIKLVAHAYNNGTVNADRKDSNSFAAKFAVTSRLDPSDVLEKVFPKEAKAAAALPDVSPVYLQNRTQAAIDRAKTAMDMPPIMKAFKVKRCACGCGKKEGECEDAKMSNWGKAKRKVAALTAERAHLRRLESDVVSKLALVQEAYRAEFGDKPDSLLWLRKTASDRYGKTGEVVVDRIADRILGIVMREKFANAVADPGSIPGQTMLPANFSKGTLGAIKSAIESAEEWANAELAFPARVIQERREIDKLIGRVKASTCVLLPGETREQRDEAEWHKRSSMLYGLMGGLAGSMGSRSATPSTMDPTSLLSARVKLNDPAHRAELQRINAETMLNSLINDDEVISSYSPDQIADAFEEIGQSAPGILENRGLFRANLRRQLQGNLTPMDANDMFVQSQRASQPALSAGMQDPTTRVQ